MVPEVAANADPNTRCKIIAHGARLEMGGTSAVAVLYAGLFAAPAAVAAEPAPVIMQA